jgi:phosphoribosylformylglycinamidine cyclo-ligase
MNDSAYAQAGVDTDAGDRAVELMSAAVRATHTPQVIDVPGGFAGLIDASELRGYDRPLLATSTDGVGTKISIARALGIHDTIGQDLVAMVVDDLVVCGAKPLFMTDYIATGSIDPERIASIVSGIARACAATGCALVGGETAEHPGLMDPDEYDLAGAAVGVVEAAEALGPDRVQAGDVLIGLTSSGLHSNGYSLVRHVMDQQGWDLHQTPASLTRTLGEELLEPTRLYAQTCRTSKQPSASAYTPSRTSPVVAWPPTCLASSPRASPPASTAAPGPWHPSLACSGTLGSPGRTWNAPSTLG